MTNSARALHEIFREWTKVSSPHQIAARGLNEPEADARFQEHVVAMVHIAHLNAELDRLEQSGRNVASYRKMITPWIQAVLAYPKGFEQNNSASLFREHYLDSLEHLADLLDLHHTQLKPGVVGELAQLLLEVEELLAADQTITNELRAYLHRLVSECRQALADHSVLGTFDLQEAAFRLWVGMNAAAEQSRSKKSSWRDFARKVLPGTVSGLLVATPSLAFQAFALTQGG